MLAANSAMVQLYWDIGKVILERQGTEGWGAKVIDKLSRDLKAEFPAMKGFSPRNLKYMRAFAAAWPERQFVQQVAAQLPWFHHCVLLDRVSEPARRRWFIAKAISSGWSRNVLALQITNRAYERAGKAINNFKQTLPPADSPARAQAPHRHRRVGNPHRRQSAQRAGGQPAHRRRARGRPQRRTASTNRAAACGATSRKKDGSMSSSSIRHSAPFASRAMSTRA